jgi:hypothetical protein
MSNALISMCDQTPQTERRENRKTSDALILSYPMRRNYMLDVIVVVVTIVLFLAFIGYTEGCERL